MYRIVFAVLATVAAQAGTAQGAEDPSKLTWPTHARVHYAWADVLRVDPVYALVTLPRSGQACDGSGMAQPNQDGNGAIRVLDVVDGAGLDQPGNRAGPPDTTSATGVGMAANPGSVNPEPAQPGSDAANAEYALESRTRCQRVAQVYQEQRIAGYEVEYRYRGEIYMSRLDHDPGERLRVRVSVSPAD